MLQQSASWTSIKGGIASRSRGGDSLPLFHSLETLPGMLHSALVLQVREARLRVGPEGDYKVSSRPEHLFCEGRLRELGFSPNEKVSGSPCCDLLVFKRVFLKIRGDFLPRPLVRRVSSFKSKYSRSRLDIRNIE